MQTFVNKTKVVRKAQSDEELSLFVLNFLLFFGSLDGLIWIFMVVDGFCGYCGSCCDIFQHQVDWAVAMDVLVDERWSDLNALINVIIFIVVIAWMVGGLKWNFLFEELIFRKVRVVVNVLWMTIPSVYVEVDIERERCRACRS